MWLRSRLARALVASGLLILALLYVLLDSVRDRVDAVFLGIVAAGLLVLLLPWERLAGISVGGVGVTLDSPQFTGALSATLDRVRNERLRERLAPLADVVSIVQGARVLWVDDRPDVVIGERRILRALGIEVVMAPSTEEAVDHLAGDGDFDLLITDVQREGGQSFERSGGEELHEGTNFVVLLRRGEVAGLADAPALQRIPVIFYAAYDWMRLREFTARARDLHPGATATNDVETLVEVTIMRLAKARREPIETPAKKVAT